jgi:hypothetical protein
MVYGATRKEAVAKARALALRVWADRIEHGERVAAVAGWFVVAGARGTRKARRTIEDAGLARLLREAKRRDSGEPGTSMAEMKRQI